METYCSWPLTRSITFGERALCRLLAKQNHSGYLENLKDNPSWQDKLKDIKSPQTIKQWEESVEKSEEQVKEMLAKEYSKKSRSKHQFWKDRERNNPSQPVVGITWFEAKAYCVWLSEVTRKEYRLSTEVEWEAAACGAENERKYL